LSLALRGLGQLGPNGLSGAGHKRRRHGTNDIGKATNEDGETGDDKCRRHDCAEDIVKEDSSSAGRGKGIVGGGKEGVLT
jgi:hypothetical protein